MKLSITPLRYLSRKLYMNLKLKVQEGDIVGMFGGRVLNANQVRELRGHLNNCFNENVNLQCARHYKCDLEGDELIKKFAPMFPIRNPTYAARQ